jgi:hypothetical protein
VKKIAIALLAISLVSCASAPGYETYGEPIVAAITTPLARATTAYSLFFKAIDGLFGTNLEEKTNASNG